MAKEIRTHELKTRIAYFNLIRMRLKPFNIRYNDRDFRVGDLIIEREYDHEHNAYTGEAAWEVIQFILTDHPGLLPGYVLLFTGSPIRLGSYDSKGEFGISHV